MNKRVIILTDNYFPRAMAGGICAHKVAMGLKGIGYDVHVVCLRRKGETREDTYEGIYVHRINNPLVYKIRDWSSEIKSSILSKGVYNLAIFLNRLLKIIFIGWYPLMSPLQIRSYVSCAKKIEADAVVAEYFSLESMLAGDILHNKHGKKVVYYNVDSLSNIDEVAGISLRFARKKGERWEKKLYRNADGVVVMKCHENHYKSLFPDEEKIVISDLPLLEPVSDSIKHEKSNTYKWVYTGTLKEGYRSPRLLIETFKCLDADSELHFFSKGDCESYISDEAKKNNRIIQHGHVPRNDLDRFYKDADVLVSIGNNKGTFLPSKTIEYISQRKPIIHFCYQEKDASLPYLKEYGHSLIIDVNNGNAKEWTKKILDFLNKEVGYEISVTEIMDKFKMNTPEYTARVIYSFLYNT